MGIIYILLLLLSLFHVLPPLFLYVIYYNCSFNYVYIDMLFNGYTLYHTIIMIIHSFMEIYYATCIYPCIIMIIYRTSISSMIFSHIYITKRMYLFYDLICRPSRCYIFVYNLIILLYV